MMDRDRKGKISMQQSTSTMVLMTECFEPFEMKNDSILNIFISNPTFSRVGNSLKTMDSMDSIVNMEKPIVLYPPSYVYIRGGLAGLVHLGGTVLHEIWYYSTMFTDLFHAIGYSVSPVLRYFHQQLGLVLLIVIDAFIRENKSA